MKKCFLNKRMIALGLVLCLAFSLTACNHGFGKDLPLKGQKDSATKSLYENDRTLEKYCFDNSVIAFDGYDEEATNTALADFSLRLLEENISVWGESDTNILISPVSVLSALGMTSFGAEGETLSQMETMFGVSRANLHVYNNKCLEKLSDEVKMANSIWFTNDERVTVNEAFLQFNEEFYGAELYETAFNSATLLSINDWVSKKTDGMIPNILDKIPPDAVMYLINALVFEAEWEEKYDSIQIWKNAEFTTAAGKKQTVDMMHSDESLYLADEMAKGFIKYYKDRNYAFVALLPNEGISIAEYVKSLSGEQLQSMLSNPQNAMVNAYIPQFSYEYKVEMSELLKEMGMMDAFDESKADFSNMVTSTRGNVYITRVLHKTFIEVSPVGTKAGAATVVEAADEGMGFYDESHEVRLDRPFLYMRIDCENNQPMFIGVVNSVE